MSPFPTIEQILSDLLRREGSRYTDHPQDRGGPTKFGITLRTLQGWRGVPTTADDVRALTQEEAMAIYRREYVAPLEDAPPEIRAQLVDIAVNSGPSVAKTLWQRAERGNPAISLGNRLMAARLVYLARIVKGKPTQSVFLEGWVLRALEFLT